MKKELKSFEKFLKLVRSHVYSEPETELHSNTINAMSKKIVNEHFIDPTAKLLDIGCGSGYAMDRLRELGMQDIKGITLSQEDAEVSRSRGFDVSEQDMSFTDFDDSSFDILWVRHALEHSPFPLLTLLEFHRLLNKNGLVYIEMPSPKCTRLLEDYDNHYSIMGNRQWSCLMRRAGFSIKDSGEIKFDVHSKQYPDWNGTEVYEWYVLTKE